MAVLIAAVALVGVLCVLDLLLTVGVIRRLREHTELLSVLHTAVPAPVGVGVGEEIGEFTASTVDGETLRRDLLAGETLIGFFSLDCPACKEKLPSFLKLAQEMPGGRDQVLAAVVGEDDRAAEMAASLNGAARVVVEGYGGGLQKAFQVRGYPAVLKIGADGDGRVVITDIRGELNRPDVVAV